MDLKKFAMLGLSLMMAAPSVFASGVLKDTLGFAAQSACSPADLLAGRVAGVRVSSTDGNSVSGLQNVNIRGTGNLRSDCQPLYVIDGIILGSGLNQNLDPFWQLGEAGYAPATNPLSLIPLSRIESIEVLKNTSETALYGAQGANGVIIIRTKRNLSDPWSIDVESNLGVMTAGSGTAGLIQNHNIAFSGIAGKTSYFLTGQFRESPAVGTKEPSRHLTATAGVEGDAGSFLSFSAEVIFGNGKMNAGSSTANLGYSSWGTAKRGVTSVDTVKGWEADFVDTSEETRLASIASINVRFAPWLNWKTSLGVDYQQFDRLFFYGNGTAFGLASNGVVSVLDNSLIRDNLSTKLTFSRYFGANRITAFILGEQSVRVRTYNSMPAMDFISHVLRERGLGLSGYSEGLSHHYRLKLNQYAFSAGVSYDYNKLFGADLFLKAQYSPEFLDSPSIYPSASAYADFGAMFLKDCAAISALRLEAGYGEAGLEEISAVKDDPEIASDISQFFKGFSDIRTKEYHATLVAGAFRNRLSAEFTWYDRKTEDLFSIYCFGSNQPNHYKIGGAFLWASDKRTLFRSQSSSIANKGYELTLRGIPVETPKFKWSLDFNFAYNYNRMTEVSSRDIFGDEILPSKGIFANACVPGYQVGAIYGFDENTGLETVIGNPIPKFHGGLGSTFSFGGFSLDFLFDGSAAFDILNLNALVADQSADFVISSKYVEDGSFIRLRRVGLAYSIPVKSKALKALDVKLSAGNLFTLSRYSGYNPDVNSYGVSPMSSGLDYGSLPVARTLILGVSAKF